MELYTNMQIGVLPLIRPTYEIIQKHYIPGETIVTAHAIAFGALDPPTLKGRSIVGALSNPHTAARIDVHVARVYDHRLGREKRGFQTVGSGQLFHVGAGGLGAGGMGGRSGSGFSLWRGLFCPGSPERNR